jgi:hypothetical protein
VSGEKVVYKRVSDQEFEERFDERCGTAVIDMFVEYFKYIGEFGYFGPKRERAVRMGKKELGGGLRGFEEYLKSFPRVLEEKMVWAEI